MMTYAPHFSASRMETDDDRNDAREDAKRKTEEARREAIRQECRSQLEACAADRESAMSEKDAHDFYTMGLTEDKLEPFKTQEDKTKELEKYRDEYIPKFIRDTQSAGRKALSIIDRAVSAGWISKESGQKWEEERLKAGTWTERQKFIEETLPEWERNWENLHVDLQKFKQFKQECGLTEKEAYGIPQIAKLDTDEFARAKYPRKRAMLDEAFAALSAYKNVEGGMKALHAKAEAALQSYVSAKLISAALKARLLKSIFKHDKKTIEDFLSGKGPQPLSELREGWVDARTRFDALERRCKTEGTPRSFHFVHLNVFLQMSHGQKQTYLEQGAESFKNMNAEQYDLLLIRNAMAMKDWDDAGHLIAQAKKKDLSKEDWQRLQSMERYFSEHCPRKPIVEKDEQPKPSDRELVQQARDLISQMPPSEQRLTSLMLRKGASAFRCKRICDYNHQWCRQRGYLSDDREKDLKKEASIVTRQRVTHGHNKKGFEANDVTNPNVSEAIRDQDGINAAQVVFGGEQSAEALADTMYNQRDNRHFWYWTTYVPVSIDYNRHVDIIERINPQLQRIAYELDKRRILFSVSGDVEYTSILQAVSSDDTAPAYVLKS